MKNQYVGDLRDYFKYELILAVRGELPVSHVLMFTPDDGTPEGEIKLLSRFGDHQSLRNFLKQLLDKNDRRVIRMREFFENEHIPYRQVPLAETGDLLPYTWDGRASYFSKLCEDDLRASLVLLDPDIGMDYPGMKVKSQNLVKYLHRADLRSIIDRCDERAIVVVYQHYQRKAVSAWVDSFNRAQVILEAVKPCGVDCLSGVVFADVGFYLLTKWRDGHEALAEKARSYALRRSLRYLEVNGSGVTTGTTEQRL